MSGVNRTKRYKIKRLALLSLLVVTTAAVSAEKLTYSEVKNLPAHRLAERTLGEAGKLMMDVERPRSTLNRANLKFFSYAFATGSQYGICGSNWVTLSFDENGVIASINNERRYGVEASIYTDPKDWTYQEYGDLCRAVKNTREYFPSPDAQSALTISAYVDLLAKNGESKPSDYAFDCSGSCSKINADNYVKSIKLRDIVKAEKIDCDENDVYAKCYKLTLDGQPPGLFPRILKIYGRMRMNDVVITKVKLWVGETFY